RRRIPGVRLETERLSHARVDEAKWAGAERNRTAVAGATRRQDAETRRIEERREWLAETHDDGRRVRRIDGGEGGKCCTFWRGECRIEDGFVGRPHVGRRHGCPVAEVEIGSEVEHECARIGSLPVASQ